MKLLFRERFSLYHKLKRPETQFYMYSTCVQKICINDGNGEEVIVVVSMKHFNSIRTEFILKENTFFNQLRANH